MFRPLIITDVPGREVYYLGGLLSRLKEGNEGNSPRDRPRVVYIATPGGSAQCKEIKEISKLLNFTYEIFYSRGDRPHLNGEEVRRKIDNAIRFYKPTSIFGYRSLGLSQSNFDFGCIFNNFDIFLTSNNVSDKRKAMCKYRSYVGDNVQMIDDSIASVKYIDNNIIRIESIKAVKFDTSMLNFV